MVLRSPFILLVLMLAAEPGLAEVPSSPTLPSLLTLDQAKAIFRSHGLDLLIAEAAVRSAEANVRSAAAIFNPNWNAGLYKSFFQGNLFSSDLGFFVGLGDSNALEDILSGKRGLRVRVAREALAAARLSRADAERMLELQLEQTYLGAVAARDALDFALEVRATATHTFELTQVRYHAGAVSEADVAKVETAQLESEQAVTAADRALRVAKLDVAFLLGVRGNIPDFQVEQDLPRFFVPARLANISERALLAEALEHRPDLKGASAEAARASASLSLASRLRFPDLALSAQYSQQGSGSGAPSPVGTIAPISPPTLQFSLSGTLPVLYQQQGEIKKAKADVRAQQLLHDKIEAQVTSEVGVAFENFTSTRALVERMQERLLDRAHRARDLVAIQYQKGAASLLEYLDAQRTYIATNVEYLQDLANYWSALFQLEAAVGMELR